MEHDPRSRRRFLLPGLTLLAVLVAVGLALFQPWKLWVDDVVDEAAPPAAAATAGTTVAGPTTAANPVTSTTAAPTVTTQAAPASTAPAPTTVPAPVEPDPTSFRSKDHDTSGTVRLLTLEDGTRVLRLEDLDTSNGPDLKVVLSVDADGYTGDGAVSLGTLKGNKGSQNYEIPADVDLSSLRSVVIWCKRFDSDFGVAALPGSPA